MVRLRAASSHRSGDETDQFSVHTYQTCSVTIASQRITIVSGTVAIALRAGFGSSAFQQVTNCGISTAVSGCIFFFDITFYDGFTGCVFG